MAVVYENSLYDDTVTLIFESRRHRYVWEEKNVVVKSVTTALKIINKPALVHWASSVAVDFMAEEIAPGIAYDEVELESLFEQARWAHNKRKVEAGNVGTLLHKWIENYVRGVKQDMPVNLKLRSSVRKFLKWVEKYDVKFLASEQVTFSRKYRYCGTFDFICVIDGKKYIGDLKTSSGIYLESFLQTAAYRNAREEEFPKEEYHGQLTIRIGREDGQLEVGFVIGKENYEKMFRAFLLALFLSNEMDSLNKFIPERIPR